MTVFQEEIQRQIDSDRERCTQHGWNFKERDLSNYTIGDFTGAVLHITDPDRARSFYLDYVADLTNNHGKTLGEAERIVKANIGWIYGEGMPNDRIAMWVEVCGATHPVFGSMLTPERRPTPDEAYRLGVDAGKRQA